MEQVKALQTAHKHATTCTVTDAAASFGTYLAQKPLPSAPW